MGTLPELILVITVAGAALLRAIEYLLAGSVLGWLYLLLTAVAALLAIVVWPVCGKGSVPFSLAKSYSDEMRQLRDAMHGIKSNDVRAKKNEISVWRRVRGTVQIWAVGIATTMWFDRVRVLMLVPLSTLASYIVGGLAEDATKTLIVLITHNTYSDSLVSSASGIVGGLIAGYIFVMSSYFLAPHIPARKFILRVMRWGGPAYLLGTLLLIGYTDHVDPMQQIYRSLWCGLAISVTSIVILLINRKNWVMF